MLKPKIFPIEAAPKPVMLTIDLEDWHQLMHRKLTGQMIDPTERVLEQTKYALDCLDNWNVKATFFVLGFVAKKFPNLVKEISSRGHEIGTHSMTHRLLYTQTPAEFREEIRDSVSILEDLSGQKVLGFRAPEFSVNESNIGLLEVLTEYGLTYDSSIFPLKTRRYGYRDFPRQICRLQFGSSSLLEIPLSSVMVNKRRIPMAGGGYFRIFPQSFLTWALKRIRNENSPLCLYFHPYEFDRQYLDVATTKATGSAVRRWRANIPQNIGRASIISKISKLRGSFEFRTCRDFSQSIEVKSDSKNRQRLHQ